MIDFDVLQFAFCVMWFLLSLYLFAGVIFGGITTLIEFIRSKLKNRKARDNDEL